MTAPEITLIITTVATGIVSIIGAIKGNTNTKKLDEVKERSIAQDNKLDNIHNAANGSLSKALEQVDKLTEENNKLREDIAKFNLRSRTP